MKFMTFPRSLLLACFLLPACGDDKGDDTTATDGTSNATPATPATPASASDTMDVPTTGGTDPSGDPSTDPSGDPSTSTDPTTGTVDPTAGDGMYCQEACNVDEDCFVGGVDSTLDCVDNRCTGEPPPGCTDDGQCVATFSGWALDCAAQADCPGQVCIDIGGGVGKCAFSSDMIPCTPPAVDAMYPAIEGGMDFAVCANQDYTCGDSGQCENPCESDGDCVVPGYGKCYVDTGICGCASDADCSGDSPKCTDRGFCGCAEDANCTAAGTGDVCNDGSCGCSAASACTGTPVFDNTMYVCEGF